MLKALQAVKASVHGRGILNWLVGKEEALEAAIETYVSPKDLR